ncbi:hypothetical protein AARAC_003115 [Aspergillus arachidicola]|uniref:Uncharacterized protein n=1 Tax=Aspergillus arachidicola TaxID=656916 RepID=A0A2G7FRE8_9EURO|nr:hypothetical protein AARAC_003115 [Aspergillus arachidicola]
MGTLAVVQHPRIRSINDGRLQKDDATETPHFCRLRLQIPSIGIIPHPTPVTMTSEIIPYYIGPTKKIPNSPKPLLLYKNCFLRDGQVDLTSHTRPSSKMAGKFNGPGIIGWGVADLDDDLQKNTYGTAYESGGVQMGANTGGGAHYIESEDPRKTIANLELSGFMMMGAYPWGYTWSWSAGIGENGDDFGSMWKVNNANLDPVLGHTGGINNYWKTSNASL